MKGHWGGYVILLASALHIHAAVVHIDISRDGDIAVDLNMKQKSSSNHEHEQSGHPVYPPRKTAYVLEDYRVDLGYEVHAGLQSEDGKYIKFKNIPYAEPPIEALRFSEPISPQTISLDVNYGSNENVCPQVQVGWASKALEFLNDFPDPSLLDDWKDRITPADYGPIQLPPKNVSEDCLTLDVFVPKTVWDRREDFQASVVVWVHGGGFVYGWKEQYGSPSGLFDAASKGDEQDIVYVAMNYRLGAFGWLGGEKLSKDGGSPNAGLLDQALAMKWVRDYINSFGGDTERITMMGQSAGASSILHHITAYGGEYNPQKPSMNGAILQSPGFFPQPNRTKDDEIYTKFLELTGEKDLEALITVDTKVLQDANAKMVHDSLYGSFNFGPTIDGDYVKDLPGKVLEQREVSSPSLLLGHMNLDGLLFTPPWIRTTSALLDYVRELFPNIPQSVLDYIESAYPVPTALGPQAALLSVADFLDDIAIQCNTFYLTEAILRSGYPAVFRYVFNALPAVHGYDTGYTFYPSPPLIPPVDEGLAKYFQTSIVNFVNYGVPDVGDLSVWEQYTADDRKVMNLGDPSQRITPNYTYSFGNDPMDRSKCEYWKSAPYYSPSTKGSDQKFVVQDQARIKDL